MNAEKFFKKAKSLLNEMTLKEKIGQVSQTVGGYRCFERNGEDFTFTDSLKDFIKEYGTIGAVSNILRAARCWGRKPCCSTAAKARRVKQNGGWNRPDFCRKKQDR